MWSLVKSWVGNRPVKARRRKILMRVAVEGLELRQLLSAATGLEHIAAEVSGVHAGAPEGPAVPRINVAAADYPYSEGLKFTSITQERLNIHSVMTRPDSSPIRTLDASFKNDLTKPAKRRRKPDSAR